MTFTTRGQSLGGLRATPEVFDGTMDSFRRWTQVKLEEKTISGYLLAVRRFHAFLVAHELPTRLEEVTRQHVEMWLVAMRGEITARGKPIRPVSINRYANSLRVFFAWCVAEELVAQSPVVGIGRAREDSVPPDVLTDEEVQRLFKACEGRDYFARRDMALMRVWFATGIRRQELVGLRLEDVNLDARMIRVHGKNRKARDVRIGRRTVVALDRYLALRRQHRLAHLEHFWLGSRGQLKYEAIYAMLQRRSAQAGIRHIYPHLWRHTMAHRYLAKGGSEVNLEAHMGWGSNSQMLRRYGASMIASRARDEYDRLGLDDEL